MTTQPSRRRRGSEWRKRADSAKTGGNERAEGAVAPAGPSVSNEARPTPDTPNSGSQGRVIIATESGVGTQQGNFEKPIGTIILGVPSELHKARQGEVTADNPISTDTITLGKQVWGTDSFIHRNKSKSPKIGMWTWSFPNIDLDCIRSTYPEGGNALSNRASDTIRETQPLPKY